MTFEVKVGIVNADEVLSVRDMKTTLYFTSVRNDKFYGQFDDKDDEHIFVLHPDFIPKRIESTIKQILGSSRKAGGASIDDVVVAPAGHRFIVGNKVTLDVRHQGKLIGSFDPDFKLRSIKKQRLSKKFKRTFKK